MVDCAWETSWLEWIDVGSREDDDICDERDVLGDGVSVVVVVIVEVVLLLSDLVKEGKSWMDNDVANGSSVVWIPDAKSSDPPRLIVDVVVCTCEPSGAVVVVDDIKAVEKDGLEFVNEELLVELVLL